MNLPKITIAIPVLNEEANLGKCLSRIFSQGYPEKKIEVLIVDAGSADNTLKIAKKFGVRILFNKVMKDPESGKMVALKHATGEYFMYLDADMFLPTNNNWFAKMLKPFENPKIEGTFTKFIVNPKDRALNRYLSYDALQRDPLYRFLTPGIESIIVSNEKGYSICKLRMENPPPIGLCLCRTKLLRRFFKSDRLIDMEVPLTFLKKGYPFFAYVPDAGINHLHAKNIRNLLKKRIRNIDQMNRGKSGYLPDYEKRLFKWADFKNKATIFKLGFWMIYANIFLPLLVTGIIKSIRYRDSCFLLEPIVGLLVTDVVAWGFIRNKKGLKVILGGVK